MLNGVTISKQARFLGNFYYIFCLKKDHRLILKKKEIFILRKQLKTPVSRKIPEAQRLKPKLRSTNL